MPRIFPTDWRTQLKIFESHGCKYKRKQEMQKTAALFEQTGFTKEIERDRFFTRFVRLRKRLY